MKLLALMERDALSSFWHLTLVIFKNLQKPLTLFQVPLMRCVRLQCCSLTSAAVCNGNYLA